MEEKITTRTYQSVEYSFLFILHEKENDPHEIATKIEVLFPVNVTPVIPRKGELYFNKEIPYVITLVSHRMGHRKEDETKGAHMINIGAVKAIIVN